MRDMAARADNNSAGSFSDRPRSAPPVPPRQKEINTRRSQPDMSFGGIRYADALAMVTVHHVARPRASLTTCSVQLEKNEPDPHDEVLFYVRQRGSSWSSMLDGSRRGLRRLG